MFCKVLANESAISTAEKIIESLFDNKVVHVAGGPTDHVYWKNCASCIGELSLMEEGVDGNKTGKSFTDIKHPWHEKSNSFSHSNTRQPLHTDGSYESNAPDLSFFYCKESAEFGGDTVFVDNMFLINILEKHEPDLLHQLRSEIVTHTKGDDFKLSKIIDGNKLNWNYYRCVDCNLSRAFHAFLEKHIVEGCLFDRLKLEIGDAVFFKDQELLHGRTSFLGNRWLVKGGIYV